MRAAQAGGRWCAGPCWTGPHLPWRGGRRTPGAIHPLEPVEGSAGAFCAAGNSQGPALGVRCGELLREAAGLGHCPGICASNALSDAFLLRETPENRALQRQLLYDDRATLPVFTVVVCRIFCCLFL